MLVETALSKAARGSANRTPERQFAIAYAAAVLNQAGVIELGTPVIEKSRPEILKAEVKGIFRGLNLDEVGEYSGFYKVIVDKPQGTLVSATAFIDHDEPDKPNKPKAKISRSTHQGVTRTLYTLFVQDPFGETIDDMVCLEVNEINGHFSDVRYSGSKAPYAPAGLDLAFKALARKSASRGVGGSLDLED